MKILRSPVQPWFRRFQAGLVLAALATVLSSVSRAQPDREGPRDEIRDGAGGGGPVDPLSDLSEEEKKRVREALAEVWQDAEVMAAKEVVQESTEAYREALKQAVLRVDPSIAALMEKMHEQSRSHAVKRRFDEGMRHGGPGGRGPGGGWGRPADGTHLPEFFRALDDEQKRIYLDARSKAEKSEALRGLREELAAFEKRTNQVREQRFRMMMRMRRAMREEMIRIDPRLEAFYPEEEERDRPPGGPDNRGPKPDARKGGPGGPQRDRPAPQE